MIRWERGEWLECSDLLLRAAALSGISIFLLVTTVLVAIAVFLLFLIVFVGAVARHE